MIDFIVLFAFLSLLPIHEFGHYVIAWRFGWKPKLKLVLWKKCMPSMAVYTEVDANLKNEKDFLKLYGQLTAFGSMGILFPLIAILIFFQFRVFNIDVAFVATLIFVMYGICEVSFPQVKIEENIGE